MRSASASPQMRPDLTQGTSYDDVKAGKPPIAIQVAPKPSQARLDLHPMHRAASSTPDLGQTLQHPLSRTQEQGIRRDSGLGTASKRESRATTAGTDRGDAESVISEKFRNLRKSPSLPRLEEPPMSPSRIRTSGRGRSIPNQTSSSTTLESAEPRPDLTLNFDPPSTDAPMFSFEDLSSPSLQFSNRGSLLVRGRRPSGSPSRASPTLSSAPGQMSPMRETPETRDAAPAASSVPQLQVTDISSDRKDSVPSNVSRASLLPSRILSTDEETLSRRILSMYDIGSEDPPALGLNQGTINGLTAVEREGALSPSFAEAKSDRKSVLVDGRSQSRLRDRDELAGGLEDWSDVRNDEVDRYGFIVKSLGASRVSLHSAATAPEGAGISRIPTQLRLAAETPRRERSFRARLGRRGSNAGSSKSTPLRRGPDREDGRRSAASNQTSKFLRPASSQASYRSSTTIGSSLRRVGNHLPHNKGRRCVDEAGDMLTLPPGLADIAESEAGGERGRVKSAESLRAREREREEKWRKMAKMVKPSTDPRTKVSGGGMQFTFDVSSPKLVSRTWKGIPDRWRATAWWAFMEHSAKKQPGSLSSETLIAIFHELVDKSCADDVQIDLDVPRTIGGHVMFRRRYAGGQRLLFRVLHAMSLHFPDPGYVQGMATLAATLLCYFEEERAFVMLVRMWELRGLARLYEAGFKGLMSALDEFKTGWIAGGIVGEKLDELGIPPTSYGTRWYLTVFNYSIPFSAQLRVWDIFLLLGDADPPRGKSVTMAKPASTLPKVPSDQKDDGNGNSADTFHGSLDVLHAVSAALIDGTREILLDSDFDNAMKTLTSWIPIRDDELLMRVAKVEFKYHRQRR